MPEPLLEVRALDAFYGDFQALFGVSLDGRAGRGGRRHRRQRRRQEHAAQDASPALMPVAPRCDRCSTATPIGDLPAARGGRARHRAGAGRAPALSLALGRGEPADRRPARPARAAGRSRASTSCFRCCAERRHLPSTSLSGGQQQMVRDRPRADVQSEASALRRDQPRACARSSCATSTRACPRSSAEGSALIIVEQDIVQALERGRPRLSACRRAASRSPAPPADARPREAISAAYFGSVTPHGLGQHHHPGRADRRALRHVRGRACR